MFVSLTARLLEIEQRQRSLDADRADALVEWERSREWADDGSVTASGRLARETVISVRVARERLQVSRLLASSMPLTRAALDALGWPKAKLLASAINPRTAAFFERDEAVLVEQAQRLSVDQLAILLGHWKRIVDEDGANADADSQHDSQYLQLSTSWDGQGFLKGRLDPEATAIVKSVLDQIADELYRSERRARIEAKMAGEDPDPLRGQSERAADALVEMARRAAATTASEAAGVSVILAKPLVTIHMDVDWYGEVKARFADGTPIPTRYALRLACDAAIVRAITKEGTVPLELGRTVRDPSDAQRRALGVLWATCAHPTCDRPFAWCQLHHVWHWDDGGPTDVGWLLPLCGGHHRLHHKGAFDIIRRPNGTFLFVRPDGTEIGPANPTISQLFGCIRTIQRAA